MQARSAGRRRYIEAVFNANEPEPHMKRALCLTVLLSTTAALLSACIVVPPRAAAARLPLLPRPLLIPPCPSTRHQENQHETSIPSRRSRHRRRWRFGLLSPAQAHDGPAAYGYGHPPPPPRTNNALRAARARRGCPVTGSAAAAATTGAPATGKPNGPATATCRTAGCRARAAGSCGPDTGHADTPATGMTARLVASPRSSSTARCSGLIPRGESLLVQKH